MDKQQFIEQHIPSAQEKDQDDLIVGFWLAGAMGILHKLQLIPEPFDLRLNEREDGLMTWAEIDANRKVWIDGAHLERFAKGYAEYHVTKDKPLDIEGFLSARKIAGYIQRIFDNPEGFLKEVCPSFYDAVK